MPKGQAVQAAIHRVADRMTPALRNRALEAGWPEAVAERLSVVHAGAANFRAHYNGDWHEVDELEYGTQQRGPAAVLGPFFNSRDSHEEFRRAADGAVGEIHSEILEVFR